MKENYILAEITPHCLDSSKVVIRCTLGGPLAYITSKRNAKKAVMEANAEWSEMLLNGSIEQLKGLCHRNGISLMGLRNKEQILRKISKYTLDKYGK